MGRIFQKRAIPKWGFAPVLFYLYSSVPNLTPFPLLKKSLKSLSCTNLTYIYYTLTQFPGFISYLVWSMGTCGFGWAEYSKCTILLNSRVSPPSPPSME